MHAHKSGASSLPIHSHLTHLLHCTPTRLGIGTLDTYFQSQPLIQPSACLAGLDTLLTALGQLEEGKYVLRHEAGGVGGERVPGAGALALALGVQLP